VAALDVGDRIGQLSFRPYISPITAAIMFQQAFHSYVQDKSCLDQVETIATSSLEALEMEMHDNVGMEHDSCNVVFA
jgi:hypothetical protein